MAPNRDGTTGGTSTPGPASEVERQAPGQPTELRKKSWKAVLRRTVAEFQDDELAEHALSRVAQTIAADRSLDMIYSDEDKVELDGRHVEPYFKPDWSPELFLASYFWH